MTSDEIARLYEISLPRAQQQPERSRALPQYAYGDPAKTVKFESEKKGRKKCSHQ